MKQIIVLSEESDKVSGLVSVLAANDYQVHVVHSAIDLELSLLSNPRIRGIVASITQSGVATEIRNKHFSEKLGIITIDLAVFSDVPELIDQIASAVVMELNAMVEDYTNSMLPPFTKALMDFTKQAPFVYCTPGHFGGSAFNKSPVGTEFYDFYGDNIFKSDLSVSMDSLGSLLDHSGPHKDAEEYIAKVANADRSYIVTNGTSTANKIVGMFSAPAGSTVLIDRNCHKSLTHLMMMSDVTPTYFRPTRNAYGMLGGIPKSEFTREAIAGKVAKVKGAHTPDYAVITNSTYDGLFYKTKYIKENLDAKRIHFDSAWVPYTNFHPIYEGLYGMSGEAVPGKLIFETHSTHKLLAAFSQASTIHMKGEFDEHTFNEAYMMHTSTSPNYPIVASTELASAMMAGPEGKRLMQNAIDVAMRSRVALATKYKAAVKNGDWYFKPWQPDDISTAECWELKDGDAWHGFKNIDNQHMHLDPIKLTVLTPGIENDKIAEHGVPAKLVVRYLEDNGIIVEKAGPYNILFLYSIGIDDQKAQAVLTALDNFKAAFDRNDTIEDSIPSLFAVDPEFYAGKRLQEVAQGLHDVMKKYKLPEIMFTAFDVLPELEMTPHAAFAEVLKGHTEEVYLEDSVGRVQANMILPYPPGVPLVLPGEKITEESKPVLDFLLMLVEMGKYFPGFATDIHGAYPQEDGRYTVQVIKQ